MLLWLGVSTTATVTDPHNCVLLSAAKTKSSSSTKQYNASGQWQMEIRSQIRRHCPIWSNYPSALTVNYCSYFANDTVSEQKWLWEILDLKMNSNYNEIYLQVKNTTHQCQNCNKVWLIADTVWPTLGINLYLTICFRHWMKREILPHSVGL